MKKTFDEILKEQKKFSDLVYGSNINKKDKEEIFKSLLLSLHYEVSDLSSLVNIKNHVNLNKEAEIEDLKFKSVDVFRYILAILNLWEVSSEDFLESFDLKDKFLHIAYEKGLRTWSGQDVVIVDIDDVIADFREFFRLWIKNKIGFTFDYNSKSYFGELKKDFEYTTSDLYDLFVKDGQTKNIPSINLMIKEINKLHDNNIYIQLLTARPKENLKCFYETYYWINKCGIKYDSLDFSYGKYVWILQQEYSKNIIAAIDDSPKHALEYATHGIKTLVPNYYYNSSMHHKNIIKFNISDFSLSKLI